VFIVGSKADRRAARERVGAYHEACLGGGSGAHLEMVAAVLDRETDAGVSVDWWDRAAPAGHQSGSE